MHMRERRELLQNRLPELFGGAGKTLLYIGANPDRFQFGAELQAAGYDMTVLEIYEPYAEALQAGLDVVVGDVRGVGHIELPHDHYDVAFWWHGPEHVAKMDVPDTLAQLEDIADLVVIGCPWGTFEQGAVDGNEWQEHKSTWYAQDFRRLGYRVLKAGRRDQRLHGYLVAWKRDPLPTVIGVVIAYNEEAMLPGCLESLQGQVSHIVVVDGAYENFPHDVPYSTDATCEIARAYGATVIPCPGRAWHTQVEKRTAYLVGAEGQWYFWIDADERIVGLLPVPEDGKHYAFRIRYRGGQYGYVPRLFQHQGHMRYEGSHNALWSDDRLIHMDGVVMVDAEECHFEHLTTLRSVDRQLDKRVFYRKRDEYERPYRIIHGI